VIVSPLPIEVLNTKNAQILLMQITPIVNHVIN